MTVLDRADRQPSGSTPSATGHRVGTRRLRELLAARGEAGLWLAEDDDGGETLVRLYPGLPKLEEWHALELAASQVAYALDSRLVPIEEIALDVWPRLTFACSGAESLSQRIVREPMAPEAAVAMCADVAGALAVLARAGVPPVDVSPADVVFVGDRPRLLADVGLPGGKLGPACVDLAHAAPERAAAIADRAQGVRALLPGGASPPTPQSMTYALASIVAAAIHGPQQGLAATALHTRLEQVLRRGLAHRPSERYGTPAALVEALGDAIGVDLRHSGASRYRATLAGGAKAAGARRRASPERRRGIAIPAAAAAVLVAAAIGTVAGSVTTTPDPPAPVTLSAAGVSVEAPRGWVRGDAGEGKTIGDAALVARPPRRSKATALVITRSAAPLLAQLADARPEAVRLGEHEAWRYREVAVEAGSVADVYVLEDGSGPVVAACVGASAASASGRVPCSAALTTLRLSAGRAAALGGDPAARRGLARDMEELGRARARDRRALADAATGRRQAAAADRLAAAYARAAEAAASGGTVGAPGALPRLVERLEETGRTYAALATAARASRRTAYARARERIVAHEHALREDIAALGSASSGA
jgi:hypothetical protein